LQHVNQYEIITPKERRDRLRLIRSSRIGPILYRQLMARFGNASAALDAVPDLGRRGGARSVELASSDAVEEELERLEKIGAQLLTYGETAYPRSLMAVEDAPPALAVLGRPELLKTETVAIVGARNASVGGRRLARELSAALGGHGFVVASGMARGIDRAVHEGAMDTGTIAVMAGGVDVPYPDQNRDIYERLLTDGAVVSELPPGVKPTARHFPPRNRIVSGLSLGVVIVEGAQRSGSLITARMAAEQGRLVLCVPGSPLDPRARGPNLLIREGATLVQSGDDIVEALRPLVGGAPNYNTDERMVSETGASEMPDPSDSELEQGRTCVVECLSPTATTVDEIIRECHMSPSIVYAVLLELELAGRIERQPGNRIATV
jgi:DNA processing protein